jgi:hypothetical protein
MLALLLWLAAVGGGPAMAQGGAAQGGAAQGWVTQNAAAHDDDPPWSVVCSAGAAPRRCTVSHVQAFADNRGGSAELTVSIVRDPDCTTVHVLFDGPVDTARPAWLAVDGGSPWEFYDVDELAELGRALDGDRQARVERPEFRHFLAAAAATPEAATPEEEARRGAITAMIDRFAAVKEPRRLGLSCAPAARLLPLLQAGARLHVEFTVQPRNATRIYHWPQLNSRAVEVPLDGLEQALRESSAAAP